MAIIKVEMTNKQVLTLAATIGTCCLVGLEHHLPKHAALARKVQALEKAIAGLAQLAGADLDEDMVDIGTNAWSAAMKYVGKRLNEVPA